MLLSLVAAVSRTVLAMAREGTCPAGSPPCTRSVGAAPRRVDGGRRTVAVVSPAGVTAAVGFTASRCSVYYAITNAVRVDPAAGPGPTAPVRALAALGLVGCLLLAVNLTWPVLVAGTGLYAAAAVGYLAFQSGRVARLGSPAPGSHAFTAPMVKPVMNRLRNRLNTNATGRATSTVAASSDCQ